MYFNCICILIIHAFYGYGFFFPLIQVYVASNVELVTKTRTEHLSDTDKKKYKASRSAFQSFLGIMEVDERTNTMQVFGVIILFSV